MIVFLRLSQFYVGDHPNCIVVRDRHVLDASDTALGLGVQLGMPIAVAKTLLAKINLGTQVIPYKPEDYSTEWLDRCVPFTDVIEPVDQHEAFFDLSAHPDPMRVFEEMLTAMGRKAAFGVAHTKWMAKVALERSTPTALRVPWEHGNHLAYYEPVAFLNELPTSMLEPVLPESRARLEFLGYRTAGYVSDIPLETLRAQFGKEALTIWQAARGRAGEPVHALYPDASVADRFYFESPVDTLEPVQAALAELAERLSKKLQAKDLQGSILRLWVGYEDEPEKLIEREFAKPMQSAASIQFACVLLLNGARTSSSAPLGSDVLVRKPVMNLRIQLPQLTKSNRQQQRLYVARTDSHAAAQNAMGQVQKVFGSDAVKLGSEIKLPRRQLVLRAWKDATGWA